MHRIRQIVVVLATALVVLPSVARAQRVVVRRDRDNDRYELRVERDRAPSRDILLGVGVLRDDLTDDDVPMAALRAGWRLRSWLRSEVGGSYALADAIAGGDGHSQLIAATVGLQAELPWPVVRPYVGGALGLAARFDDQKKDFVRPTFQVPVGVRIPLMSRLSLQGEVRWRFDELPSGGAAVNREHTVGVRVGF